jgi:mannose-6-phosphate isomerase-like protein (cupin superfamily)
MNNSVVNLESILTKIGEYWLPKIIAQMNGFHVKLVKVQGEFAWHSRADTDEVFIILTVN